MKLRTTLDLDESLLAAVDGAAERAGESRAAFIVQAVRMRLAAVDRARIDAAFEAMAEDVETSDAMARIARELDPASDAAWQGIDHLER